VLAALARPTVGYLDTSYIDLMQAVQQMLRRLFVTNNEHTLTITGSGTAAMEAAIVNIVERGDRAIACVHGYFGDRMRQILERAGAEVHVVEAAWGEPIDPSAVRRRLEAIGGAKVVTVIHGETSTGVQQDLVELAAATHAHGAVLIADAVASLGGVDFRTDEWGVDVAYTGSQKCLSVPPGVSPITFGPRALEAIERRSTPCQSWYLDLALNMTYWASPPAYHHTGPINLMYALHEGLCIVEEEGLEHRLVRCLGVAQALWAGLEALGLELLVAPAHRLASLTTVKTPAGIDEARVRNYLMDEHGIEIAGGLGPLKGRTWRIGLMGASCVPRNVELLLTALETALRAQGHACTPGAATAAAAEHFTS
jgi:alanine-glyoxylate transaminase / serine-glyoxylate transaminase / serine-pyruvate transaminase